MNLYKLLIISTEKMGGLRLSASSPPLCGLFYYFAACCAEKYCHLLNISYFLTHYDLYYFLCFVRKEKCYAVLPLDLERLQLLFYLYSIISR